MFEDLSLFAREDADGALALRANYRADRIDESTIRRMVDDFAAVAAHVVEHPATRLSDLPSQALRPALRPSTQWNDIATEYLARFVCAGDGRAPGRTDARCRCSDQTVPRE